MYRVVSSYAAAARYHSWCARYSDRSVVTECAFDTHAQCLATVGGVGSCLRCVSSARCPTDFFAKYRRSGGACPFLVGILAACFRCLIKKIREVIAGNKDPDPSSRIATSTEAPKAVNPGVTDAISCHRANDAAGTSWACWLRRSGRG